MDDIAALHRLGVALAIGLLVGAERHWRLRDEEGGRRTAGVRTFGLSGLAGGLAAMVAASLPEQAGAGAGVFLGLCFLGQGAAFVLYDLREAEAEGRFSVTSVIAAQATFLLGVLAVLGDVRLAGAAAVALTGLLAARESLHAFMARLRWEELRSAVVLLAMTLVAWPLVPDQPLVMLGGLNPAQVWLLAVILAAIGFAGYVAMRLFGAGAGQAIAGVTGGLVSSTAVTLANARGAAARPVGEASLAGGALISGGVSHARTAVLAMIGSAAVGGLLAPALAVGTAVQILSGLWLLRRTARPGPGEAAAIGNPFELRSVLKFALLLALVGLLAERAAKLLGQAGAFAVAGLTGLADVDAVTLGMTPLVPDRMAAEVAAAAIMVAVISNGLAKSAYALALGSRGYGLRFAAGTLPALVAAGAVLWLGIGRG